MLENYTASVKGNSDEIKVISEEQSQLKRESEERKELDKEVQRTSLREIIAEQEMEFHDRTEKLVVQIIKQNDNLVRDAVKKKKCVVVFGLC